MNIPQEFDAKTNYRNTPDHAEYSRSASHNYIIELEVDDQFVPSFKVTISQKDGLIIFRKSGYASYEEAEGIVSDWKVQLNLISLANSGMY